MAKNNYYHFSAQNKRKVASAFPHGGGLIIASDLIPELDDADELPFELDIVMVTSGKDGLIISSDISSFDTVWLDYQPNGLAWPLFSERLRTIVVQSLTGKEGVSWIKATVNGHGERRFYYIPRFEKKLDVLDHEQTKYVKGTDLVIIPHFSLLKVSEYSVFHVPTAQNRWKITSGLYINEKLKQMIIKEKLTGVDFEQARAS